MREISPRLPCPVCLGTTMERVALGPGGALQLDSCRRCGGVWLEHGEVQQLRSLRNAELWSRIDQRPRTFLMGCHDCHRPMERADEECPACGWTNRLDCPSCERPMRVESHAGLRLDVCHHCRGVWFDNHELRAIWGASFDHALRQRAQPRSTALDPVGEGAGQLLFETLFYAPELVYYGARAAGHAAAASAEVASQLPDALAATPEAAAAAFEAAGEAAGSVFEVIVQVVGGIFEGL